MSKIRRVHVDDELSFLVETDEEELNIVDTHDKTSFNLPPGAVQKGAIKDKIEDMKQTVKSVVSYVREGFLTEIHPDELTLEFSIALKGEISVPVLIKKSAGATFKITAKWKGSEDK